MRSATFRFYEELNDFLPAERRKVPFTYEFSGNPAVKDAVEALGVPHTEIDLILANGRSVDFFYHLQNDDMISVYPVFESIDISPVTRLRQKPLREPKFILDVHLGTLAKYLRILGFDTLYANDYDDPEIVAISCREKRVILTRDIGLLKNSAVTHGYWLRSQQTQEQLREVVSRFDLAGIIRPFSRCIVCNGRIGKVPKKAVAEKLKPNTLRFFDTFYQCADCGRVYWRGSHYERMKTLIDSIRDQEK